MNKTFTRKELYDLIWSKPMTKLAKELNLSDNQLRKICKDYNIPTPEMGYWQKIEFGKKVIKIELPQTQQETVVSIEENNKVGILDTYQEEAFDKIYTKKNLILKVPDRLVNPDVIIQKVQENIKQKQQNDWVKRSGIINMGWDVPRINSSIKQIPRVLRILDVLVKNFRILNYKISIENKGMYIHSDDEKMEIYIIEKSTAKDTIDKNGWKNRDLTFNGKLAVKIQFRWNIFEFSDNTKNLVEDKIVEILTKIESEFLKAKEQNRLRAIERKKEEEIRQAKLEVQKIKENELSKFKRFYNAAHRWKQYMILNEYFEFLKSNELEDSEMLEWIKKKLDWYNPYLNGEDDLLFEVNKETLTFNNR